MTEITEITETKQDGRKNLPQLFKAGVSGNPNGRPVGSISAITRVKQIFEESPAEFEDFIRAYIKDPSNRKHIVEMLDGSPKGIGIHIGDNIQNNYDNSPETLELEAIELLSKDYIITRRTE